MCLLLGACSSGTTSQQTPDSPVWQAEGLSANERKLLDKLGLEAIFRVIGGKVVASRPDGSPHPELQSAISKFVASGRAPVFEERPTMNLLYVVIRAHSLNWSLSSSGVNISIAPHPSQNGFDFFSALQEAALPNCHVFPVYVPKSEPKFDLDLDLNVSHSAALQPGKQQFQDCDGLKVRLLKIRKHSASDSYSSSGTPDIARSTIIVGYEGQLEEFPGATPMRKSLYTPGTWEYVDRDGKLRSKLVKNLDFNSGDSPMYMPRTEFVSKDELKRTLTFVSNLAPSEIPGITLSRSRQLRGTLVGIPCPK